MATIWFYTDHDDTASLASRDSDQHIDGYTDLLHFDAHVEMNEENYAALEKTKVALARKPDQPQHFYLKKPTASSIASRCLHPAYFMLCKKIESLEHLAEILRVPEDWRARIDSVRENEDIRREFRRFNNLPEAAQKV
jgi:hypothetical protein